VRNCTNHLIFKYNSLPDEFSNGNKKPIAKITLKGKNSVSLDILGLIDSGADISVIPRGLAEFLKLKFEVEQISKGIGGDIKVWNSKVDITVRGGHEKYEFTNIPIQIAENDNIPIIIGRAGFFEKFEITIDEKMQKVKLKRKS
jgi:hypothetical protein